MTPGRVAALGRGLAMLVLYFGVGIAVVGLLNDSPLVHQPAPPEELSLLVMVWPIAVVGILAANFLKLLGILAEAL